MIELKHEKVLTDVHININEVEYDIFLCEHNDEHKLYYLVFLLKK